MDEYEIGQVYPLHRDGELQLFRYLGGPVTQKGSWQPVTDSADLEAPRIPVGEKELAALERIGKSQKPPFVGAVGDFATSVAGGIPFMDELVGALNPEAGEAFKQRVEDLRTLRPGAALASEFAGSALPATGVGQSLARRIAPGAGRFARTVLSSLGGGATGGAAYGAGAGETPAERARGAATGLLLGGAAGVATGGTFHGAVRLGELLLPRISGAAKDFARANLRRTLDAEGINPSDLPAKVRGLHEKAVVADLSPALAQEARAAADVASELRRRGGPVPTLAGRQQERGQRIARDVQEASRLEETFEASRLAAEENLEATRQRVFGPLDEAFDEIEDAAVREVLSKPELEPAVRKVLGTRGEDGNLPVPSFRQVQSIRNTLRGLQEAAKRSGRTDLMEDYHKGLQALDDVLDVAVPGFRNARREYAQGLQRVTAHDEGYNDFLRSPMEIRSKMDAMTTPEARTAYRVGLLRRFQEEVGKTPSGGTRGRAVLRAEDAPTELERLRTLVEGDDEMEGLLRRSFAERAMESTERRVIGGSPTSTNEATIAQQMAALLRDTVTPQRVISNLLLKLGSLTPAENRQAAQLLGNALLTGGEAAAELMADRMKRFGVSNAAATFGGALSMAPVRGLLDPEVPEE